MNFPPSLPPEVRARAFRATNGELGIRVDDVSSFLNACEADNIELLGWEVWLVDHEWGPDGQGPVPSAGRWCGAIPTLGSSVPSVVGGEGNLEGTRDQISAYQIDFEIEGRWSDYVRINFTLDVN